MSINWFKSSAGITVVLSDGTPKLISSDNDIFQKVIDAIKQDDLNLVEELLAPPKVPESGIGIDGNYVTMDGLVLPQCIANKALEIKELGLPYEPLIKFYNKLKNNPSYRAVNELFLFLDKNNHPITSEGNFIAYKRVKEDFTDIYTGTFCNKPGSVVEMPRNLVDDNPNNTCSKGLHVANFEYASKHFGSEKSSTDKMVIVEINPENVVSIPVDYNNAKMRVCAYVVIKEVPVHFENEYSPIYDYHDYHDDYYDDYDNCDCGDCESCDICHSRSY